MASNRRWRELLAEASIEALYGWFDHMPYKNHEDSIWVCRRQ